MLGQKQRNRHFIASVLVLFSVGAAAGSDILITNALVVDGTGKPPILASVRIRGSQISDVGNLISRATDKIIDAKGNLLAPGFIDTHSHSDALIFVQRDVTSKITQGITTVVVGQDGDSAYPLETFFSQLEKKPSKVNVASYVGHNTLRAKVMGRDHKRNATKIEIETMSQLLRKELNAGAIGLSTGLEYEPGIYSSRSEVLALAKQTSLLGGKYISHLRSEDRWLIDSIEEIIEIGRATKMPVKISHLKLAMKSLWGTAPEIIERLDAARADGVNITADIYPYTYWQSTMVVLLPERDPTDKVAIDFALRELAAPEDLIFTHFSDHPQYVGRNLAEIAILRGETPAETFARLSQKSIDHGINSGVPADSVIGKSMYEEDVQSFILWPHTNICTDGGLLDRHPRGYGSFPRVLGHYVRELALLKIEAAIHKMTGLPAKHLGLIDRGTIAAGFAADLVLLDPGTIIDRATTAKPFLKSVGILEVWVNGQQVLSQGQKTDAYPGRVIRRRKGG